MVLKIKTFGEAVKQVKKVYSALGIEYWQVYVTEVGRYNPDIHHTENSEELAYPGMMFEIRTALIVSDNIELFIDQEDFLFVLE